MRSTSATIPWVATLLLVTGLAVGLWLWWPESKRFDVRDDGAWVLATIFLGGGLTLPGVPLLLREQRAARSRWRAGRLAWFAIALAGWSLWPALVVVRIRSGELPLDKVAGKYVYWAPLMAVFLALAFAAGGWLRRRRRRARRPPWSERFGRYLAAAWILLGLYVLVRFVYVTDVYTLP